MYSYILIVVAAASGWPAQITTHEFRNLEACETAKEFVIKVDTSGRGLVWREQFIAARCVLSSSLESKK